MKKISFLLVLVLVVSMFSVSAAEKNVPTRNNVAIEGYCATEEELAMINKMLEENPDVSVGEIVSIVFKDLYNEMTPNFRKSLFANKFISEVNNDAINHNYSNMTVDAVNSFTSFLRTYGASLEYGSKTVYVGSLTDNYIHTQLYNVDTNKVVSYLYNYSTTNNVSTLGVLDPPTGNYRTQGNHIVENSYTHQGTEYVSNSQISSYVN